VYSLFLKSANTSPVFTSPPTVSLPENSSAVMTVTASDSDIPPQTVTFSIVGGADQAKFTISTSGLLSFNTPPNFEAPTDAGGNNVYEVTVQASDGAGGTATQTLSVTVTPVNDNRPVITSPDAVSVVENSTAVLTVTATDTDLPPQALAFSIIGGVDQARFNITLGGALSFNTPPDFEAPADANGDNVYVVIVEATDGSLPTVQAHLVSVTNIVSEPLTGDYNNNGTVDAADYVLWRNGGPLQNESATPGTVTAEDYGIWRANFGRAALATSAANLLGDLRGRSHPQPTDVPSPPLHSIQLLASARAAVPQPARRAAFAANRSRDEALVAWLASSKRAPDIKSTSEPFGDTLSEMLARHAGDPSNNPFELAFAALGETG
jgi:VCBS repeat-containing protein